MAAYAVQDVADVVSDHRGMFSATRRPSVGKRQSSPCDSNVLFKYGFNISASDAPVCTFRFCYPGGSRRAEATSRTEKARQPTVNLLPVRSQSSPLP